MKYLSNILMAVMMLPLYTVCSAQIKNATTETIKVYGNCGMCEATIEKAGNLKNVSKVDWNKDTKMATLTYDVKKTNQGEILKRIALAGYDSAEFLAPDDTYISLPGCCQYDRINKGMAKMDNMTKENIPAMEMPTSELVTETAETNKDIMPTLETPAAEIAIPVITEKPEQTMPEMQMPSTKAVVQEPMKMPVASKPKMETTQPITAKPATNQVINAQEGNLLTPVFESYFALKDALVQTNGEVASAKAKSLLTAINAVKMEKLPMDVHMVWMKAVPILKQNATAMANSKEIETQRSQFITVSKTMYDLIKVAKYEVPVYYQFCPMANGGKGANWLSKEKVVKNPYYGAQMLRCGKVVETIE